MSLNGGIDYVFPQSGGSASDLAGSGLTANGTKIDLGGTLTANTEINTNNNTLQVTTSNPGVSIPQTQFTLYPNALNITSALTNGAINNVEVKIGDPGSGKASMVVSADSQDGSVGIVTENSNLFDVVVYDGVTNNETEIKTNGNIIDLKFTTGNKYRAYIDDTGFYVAQNATLLFQINSSGAAFFVSLSGPGQLIRVGVPANSASPGFPNNVAWDNSFWYVYCPDGSWRRSAISTF
jgi:hypothetical protein